MHKNYDRFFRLFYYINDLVVVFVSFCASKYFRFSYLRFDNTDYDLIMYSLLVWILLTKISSFYYATFSFSRRLVSILRASVIFFLSVSMFGFFVKDAEYSRLLFMYFAGSLFILLSISHLCIMNILKWYRQNKSKAKNLLIIGAGRMANAISKELKIHPEYGFKIIGYLDDRPKGKLHEKNVIGSLKDLATIINNSEIHEIIIALPISMEFTIHTLIRKIEPEGIKIQIIPDIYRIVKRSTTLNTYGNVPVLSVRSIPLDNAFRRLQKRIFDILFSSFILIILSPVLLLVAIGVKMSSKGPVFFIQERTGYTQRNFKCYKFRSMSISSREVADTVQCIDDDPRKTAFGEFIRRTNLDELPQFFNVFLGDMSVVGPRPHMLSHTEEFKRRIDNYLLRHYVKPGITGWAQVNGWRGPTDTDEKLFKRVEYDLWYIENWTFWLDLKIILNTAFSRQSRLNAY